MELTIPAVVAWAAREFGDAEALADPAAGGSRLSYRSLWEQVQGVVARAHRGGAGAGDRVAVWGPNDGYWVLAALGALTAGGVLVPVSTRFTGPEALDVIGRSGARVLFVAGDFLGVDRLGALLRAAAEDLRRRRAGPARPVVRVPGDWAAFERRAASVTTAEVRRSGPRRCGRVTSATSCSPRGRPGGARAR